RPPLREGRVPRPVDRPAHGRAAKLGAEVEVEPRAAQMQDGEPRARRYGLEGPAVGRERQPLVLLAREQIRRRVAGDRVEDPGRPRSHRPLDEVGQRLGDPGECLLHSTGVRAEFRRRPGLVLPHQVPGHRERSEHRLDHRDVRTTRLDDASEGPHLIGERGNRGVGGRHPGPVSGPFDQGRDGPRRGRPSGRALVPRAERLREAAGTRLELDEVPPEPAVPVDRHGREIAGRPLLTVRVCPPGGRRPVGAPQGERRSYPLPGIHGGPVYRSAWRARTRRRRAVGNGYEGGAPTSRAPPSPPCHTPPGHHADAPGSRCQCRPPSAALLLHPPVTLRPETERAVKRTAKPSSSVQRVQFRRARLRQMEGRHRPTRSAQVCAGFRRSRSRSSTRRILPDTVFGSSETNSISRGYLYGAVTRFTCSWMSRASSSDGSNPGFSATNAFTISPRSGSGLPTTAASATARCSTIADSTSNGPIRYALEVITSSARPTNHR